MAAKTKAEIVDIAAAEAVAPIRRHPVVRALGFLSEFADQPPLIAICVGTLSVGVATRNKRLAVCGTRLLAAELLATKLKSLVKHRVDRTRPSVLADGGAYSLELGNDHANDLNSFPSGHTAGAVAVACAFGRDYREHRAPAYAVAAAVAAIQIPRCKHYPSDLAAGAGIGLAAAAAVGAGERFLRWAALGRRSRASVM